MIECWLNLEYFHSYHLITTDKSLAIVNWNKLLKKVKNFPHDSNATVSGSGVLVVGAEGDHIYPSNTCFLALSPASVPRQTTSYYAYYFLIMTTNFIGGLAAAFKAFTLDNRVHFPRSIVVWTSAVLAAWTSDRATKDQSVRPINEQSGVCVCASEQ